MSESLDRGSGEVQVRLDRNGGYPVFVAPGAINRLPEFVARLAPAHHYAIVADARVAELHGSRVRSAVESTGVATSLVTFPPGEREKTRERWAELTNDLLRAGVGRDGCVVALGGGVTGDLAGFVAATYMRGIPIAHLPTSLVAMVDSAVGGKTGVDLPAGKNLVGAFHPPRFVLVDPELALTLPREERTQGLAEVVKHGAILDRDYLEQVESDADALLDGEVDSTARVVLASVRIKAEVVSRDERELGMREVLNFGHTLGHALESCSGYTLPHGSAVARGMVLEARLGESIGVTKPGTEAAITRALSAVGLPVRGGLPASPDELVRATHADKKARGGEVRYVLLDEPGRVASVGAWARPVSDAVVRSLLEDEMRASGRISDEGV